MTNDPQSARDDLAFLRALLDDETTGPRSFAEAYLAAGLIYGGQMTLHAMQAMGWIGGSAMGALAIGIGPTVLFIPVLTWILIRNRRTPVHGTVGRAVGGIFAVVGLANLVLVAVVGSVAWRERQRHDLADLSLRGVRAAGRGLAVRLHDAARGYGCCGLRSAGSSAPSRWR